MGAVSTAAKSPGSSTMLRVGTRWVVAWTLVGGVACRSPGGSTRTPVQTDDRHGDASGSRSNAGPDARLERIERELREVAGHRVDLILRTEYMPRDGYVDWLIDHELGKLPKDLSGYQKLQPDRAKQTLRDLKTIEVDFDGSMSEPKSAFDRRKRRVEIKLNDYEIPDSILSSALDRGALEDVGDHYARRRVEAIPASELPEYFAYLQHIFRSEASLRADPGEPEPGRAEFITRVLELEPRVHDAELRREVLVEAIYGGQYLVDGLTMDGAAEKFGAGSKLREAETAWIAWFQRRQTELEEEARGQAAEVAFHLTRERTFPTDVFTGFDRAAFGMAILSEWASSGFPSSEGSDDTIFEVTICKPFSWRGTRRQMYVGSKCGAWYRSMVSDPDRRAQLVRIAQQGDPRLAEHVLVATIHAEPEWDDLYAFIEAFRARDDRWRFAARVLGEEIRSIDSKYYTGLYDAAVELYRRDRSRAGVALFWLTRVGNYGRTEIDWKHFEARYGRLVDARTFREFLSMGPSALESMRSMWPALGPGWSRWELIEPHVPDYLAAVVRNNPPVVNPYQVFRVIAAEMASTSQYSEIRKMKTYFESEARKRPSTERESRPLIDSLQSQIDRH